MATDLQRVDRLERALYDVGYDERLIRREFPVWSGAGVVYHDLVGFGRPAPHDMTTATILARIGNADRTIGEALDGAASLACPAALVALQDEVQLWSISGSNRHEKVFTTDYDGLSELNGRYGAALRPTGLLAAKSRGRQLTLFPVDVELLTSARAESAIRLSSLVLDAMDIALMSQKGPKATRLSRAAEIVVGVVAALVVRDKFSIDATEPEAVLGAAEQRFPGYFRREVISAAPQTLIADLFQTLGSGINYAGFDSAVVSDVYENAVVSEADRLELGIYYTPNWLADAIAATVPFEAIPPEDLVVMDPACGSGTFLLAAHNRMNGLMPSEWPLSERHAFVRSHLTGYDSDKFAVEVAKLALLLQAMPAGDSWNVARRDVVRDGIPTERRPTVILSNPPWRNTRSLEGKRHELADDFLRSALRAVKPGGFLAVILPAAWLSGGTSRLARRELSTTTSIFEIWRLTDQVFGRSSLAPCVVFAQATVPAQRQSFVFKRVLNRSGSIERFQHLRHADEQFLTDLEPGSDESLLRGPLQSTGIALPPRRLADLATIKSGPVPRPPVAERGHAGGSSWWLRSATQLLAYQNLQKSALERVRYPEEFHRAATVDPLLRRRKLLVSAKRSAENPWRIKVGLDLIGVIPRETLQMVVPKRPDEDELFSILALLSSAFASCWIDSLAPKMVIEPELLGSLPIPNDSTWSDLAQLGRQLAVAASSGDGSIRDVLTSIESAVCRGYGLRADTVDALHKHMAGFLAPEGSVRFELAQRQPQEPDSRPRVARRVVGAVLGIEDGLLRLWLAGVTREDGDVIALPATFPGWLCRPGRTLEAMVVDCDVGSAVFEYQVGSYIEEIDQMVPVASVGSAWASRQ